MNTTPTIENQRAAVSVGSDRLFGVPSLVENLREWASAFRANQHPVTLTLFRAIQTLEKMDAAMAKDDREIVRLDAEIARYRAAISDYCEAQDDPDVAGDSKFLDRLRATLEPRERERERESRLLYGKNMGTRLRCFRRTSQYDDLHSMSFPNIQNIKTRKELGGRWGKLSARLWKPKELDCDTIRQRFLYDRRGIVIKSGITFHGDGRQTDWELRHSVAGRTDQYELVGNGTVIKRGGLRKIPKGFRPRKSDFGCIKNP